MNPYLPYEAEIIERHQETDTVFTLHLRFTDTEIGRSYQFQPGQFNMLYLFGVGEVPISISSDPQEPHLLGHTIRSVGRVTEGMAKLAVGDRIGIRGPYGHGWPLKVAEGKNVIVVTGGLGCAPVVSVINYIMKRRDRYGKLTIIQGVKHPRDMIYREQYDAWAKIPDTQVFLSASSGEALWPWHVGSVIDLFSELSFDPAVSVSMMCGPEGMMIAGIRLLLVRGMPENSIYMSMERNMQCAIGHCGHCQYGGKFICKNGPVFAYPDVKELLGIKGF